MHFSSSLVALAASLASVSAVHQGFNYGSTTSSGQILFQADFEAQFAAAKALAGTNGAFSSARLYTTIQGGTTSDPIEAIAAAIKQDTTILLGMWASAGQTNINNEIAALQAAITKFGTAFTSRVIGLSVGSEDLYRITPTSFANDPNSVGTGPDTIVSYIGQVRKAIAGTALSSVPIGHVDTWTAWVNGSNIAVAQACDWVGMNTFPYFQTTDSNSISNGAKLFFDAVSATGGATGKPVWITETGWPVSGKLSNLAVASAENAKTYWDAVGCKIFGTVNTFWYALVDGNTDPTQPAFGIVGTTLKSGASPLYDLNCPLVQASSSASGIVASATSSASVAASTVASTASGMTTAAVATSAGASGAAASSVSSTRTSTGGAAVATAMAYSGALAGLLAVAAAL